MKTTLVTQSLIPHMTPVPALRYINSNSRLGLDLLEQQTAYLMTEGWNDLEIARELDLDESTLKETLVRICNKIGVCNAVELLFYFLSRGCEQMSPCETSHDETPMSSEIVKSYGLRLST